MAKSWERPWSMQEIVDNAPKWTLAGDVALLKTLEDFSEKLFSKAEATHGNLDGLLDDLNESSVKLDLVKNEFLGLQNTQFIESRVYEDDETLEITTDERSEKKESEAETKDAMKTAVLEGLQILDKYYEKVSVPASDSEDDEADSNCVLSLKDPYITRPLPYLIGTKEWYDNWHVGLLASSSEDEEEEVEEKYSDTDSESNLPVTDRRGISTSDSGTDISNRVEKPAASSTFNDTMASTDSEEYNNSIPSKPPISHLSFAEQLAAKLNNVDAGKEQRDQVVVNTKPIQKASVASRILGDILSDEPPPLDDTEDDLFGGKSSQGMFSGGAGLFDNSDDDADYFGRKKLPPTAKEQNSSTKSKVPNLFEDNAEEGMFAQKPNVKENSKKEKSSTHGLFSDEESDDDDLFSSSTRQYPSSQPSYMKSTASAVPFIPDEPPELTRTTKPAARNLHSSQSNNSDLTEKSSTSGELEADNRLLINAKQKSRRLFDELDRTLRKSNDESTRKPDKLFDEDGLKKDQLFGDNTPKDNLFDEQSKAKSGLFDDMQPVNDGKTKKVGLFDDPGDLFNDDLFSDAIFSANHARKEVKEKKKLKLFDDENEDGKNRSAQDRSRNSKLFGSDEDLFKSQDLFNSTAKERNTSSKLFDSLDEKVTDSKSMHINSQEDKEPKSLGKSNLFDSPAPDDLFGEKAKSSSLFDSPVKSGLFDSPIKDNLFGGGKGDIFDSTPKDDLFASSSQNKSSSVRDNLFDSPTQSKSSTVKENLFVSPTQSKSSTVKENLFDSPTQSKSSTAKENLFESKPSTLKENLFDSPTMDKNKLSPTSENILDSSSQSKVSTVKDDLFDSSEGSKIFKEDENNDELPRNERLTNDDSFSKPPPLEKSGSSKDFFEQDSSDEDDLFGSKPPLKKLLERKNQIDTKTTNANLTNEETKPELTEESRNKATPPELTEERGIKDDEYKSNLSPASMKSDAIAGDSGTESRTEDTDSSMIKRSNDTVKPAVPLKKPTVGKKETPAFSLISDVPPDIDDWDQKSDTNVSDDEDMFDDVPVASQRAAIFDREPPALHTSARPVNLFGEEPPALERNKNTVESKSMLFDKEIRGSMFDGRSDKDQVDFKGKDSLPGERAEDEGFTKATNKMDPKRMDFLKKSEAVKSPEDVSKRKDSPGKLKLNLNINVNALMPGVSMPWKKDTSGSSLSKSRSLEESQESERDDPPEKIPHAQSCKDVRTVNDNTKQDQDRDVETLHSITKNRARIQTKRKPSTRRARQASVKKRADEGNNNFSDDTSRDSSANTDNLTLSSENNNPEEQSSSSLNNNVMNDDETKYLFSQINENRAIEKVADSVVDNRTIGKAPQSLVDNKNVANHKTNENVADSITGNKTNEKAFAKSDSLGNIKNEREDKTSSMINKHNSSLFDELSDDSDSDIFTQTKKPNKNNSLDNKRALSTGRSQIGLFDENTSLFDESPAKGNTSLFDKHPVEGNTGLFDERPSVKSATDKPNELIREKSKSTLFDDEKPSEKGNALFDDEKSKNTLFDDEESKNTLFDDEESKNTLFDDEESKNTLFDDTKLVKERSLFGDDKPSELAKERSKMSLFEDDEDDLFAGKDTKRKEGLFDDGDIFAPKTAKMAPVSKKKGSLFDDMSEDEDIFSTGSSHKRKEKSISTGERRQARNKNLVRKSEERTVVNDPLDAMSNNF